MAQSGPAKGSWVPNWDFSAPHQPQLGGPLDSSAAAIAAFAFLTLAEAAPGTAFGARYLCAGANTLRALAGDGYLAAPSTRGGALLLHATAHQPERRAVDVGIVWGDYYLLEALAVCRRLPGCAGSRRR